MWWFYLDFEILSLVSDQTGDNLQERRLSVTESSLWCMPSPSSSHPTPPLNIDQYLKTKLSKTELRVHSTSSPWACSFSHGLTMPHPSPVTPKAFLPLLSRSHLGVTVGGLPRLDVAGILFTILTATVLTQPLPTRSRWSTYNLLTHN